MRPYDLAALILLLLAIAAFGAGTFAVSRADDIRAFYLLVIGGTFTWGSVHLARSAVRR